MVRLHVALLSLAVLSNACEVSWAEANLAEDALQATFRIKQGKTSGTGFLVNVEAPGAATKQRTVLVTAHHVFDGIKEPQATVVWRTKNPQGVFERKEHSVAMRDGDKPLWVRHPDMDVAALLVDIPEGVEAKPLEFRQLADATFAADKKIRVGQEVWIPCFPAQVEANPVGWPILRRGWIATHPLTPVASAKTIFVDYAHFGGDSGAPVLAQAGDELMLVGLVIAMQRQTDTTESPFEKRTVHTPLGLAIAVQSPLVRETVELLLKK